MTFLLPRGKRGVCGTSSGLKIYWSTLTCSSMQWFYPLGLIKASKLKQPVPLTACRLLRIDLVQIPRPLILGNSLRMIVEQRFLSTFTRFHSSGRSVTLKWYYISNQSKMTPIHWRRKTSLELCLLISCDIMMFALWPGKWCNKGL